VTIRLKKGLLKDYTALCKLKRTDRSKRIRNFMIYELKKDQATKAESSPTEEIEKPKDLNTGVSTN
jgi:hypothetical protein